jgi:peptide/nickel transport system substrate-binding protein
VLNLTQPMTAAEAIKAMLARVGIAWTVDFLDPAAISERMMKLDYDFAAGGWTWIYDPDLIATGLYHPEGGYNFGRSNNPQAIALIEAGRKEVDFDKRTRIYQALEKVLYDNYEDVWLWWPRYVTVARKNIQGMNEKMANQFKEAYTVSHPGWFKDGRENRGK